MVIALNYKGTLPSREANFQHTMFKLEDKTSCNKTKLTTIKKQNSLAVLEVLQGNQRYFPQFLIALDMIQTIISNYLFMFEQ